MDPQQQSSMKWSALGLAARNAADEPSRLESRKLLKLLLSVKNHLLHRRPKTHFLALGRTHLVPIAPEQVELSPVSPRRSPEKTPLHLKIFFFGLFHELSPTQLYFLSHSYWYIQRIRTYIHFTPLLFQTQPQSLTFSIPVKMGSTVLPYMETKPKMIFFTDFDGTITVDDSELSFTSQLAMGQC